MKGEKDKTKLTRDKPGVSTPVFEGQCAGKVLQSDVSGGKGWRHTYCKDTRVIGGSRTREVPENGHVEVRVSLSKKIPEGTAQLKGIHNSAHGMGKKEELEAIAHQDNHDIVTIMETWWVDLHDWSAAVDD